MKVAMLGLGAMGSRMAARAVAAGHEVVTWNRSPRTIQGARAAARPCEAADGADTAVSMVTDVDASRAVWLGSDGALAGLAASAVAVEASTVTPAWTEELAATVRGQGAGFVAAPVVGTRPHAERGQLTVLAGGSETDLAQARDVLETWGTVVSAGSGSAAMALKLAINSMFATQVAMLVEAVALLGAHGLDTDAALQRLEGTPVFAPVLHPVAALLRAGSDDPLFPVDLVAKDLGYAASQASLPLFDAVRARFLEASQAGLGDRNLHAVARLYG